jgi:hypothetical protein
MTFIKMVFDLSTDGFELLDPLSPAELRALKETGEGPDRLIADLNTLGLDPIERARRAGTRK